MNARTGVLLSNVIVIANRGIRGPLVDFQRISTVSTPGIREEQSSSCLESFTEPFHHSSHST